MSKSKNQSEPSNGGRIEKENVADEMKRSFLEYSMSVIVSRALPDVRDGLKPVHRRILYSLHEQNIKPDGPFKKCARVVGDVMGKYHPHGDSAIYDAMVRLAQEWSMGVPVVDGHGNFGSLDDGPAAARYTECRMAAAGAAMLAGITENTVDFRDNYDGTEQEPSVLPASYPNLLVNGGTGIAVGMATNIPPHNLGELVEGIKLLSANPKATVDDLMAHIPGPDFPTGGIVVGDGAIRDAFETGRGTFKIRAKAEVTDVTPKRKGIVITELPFAVGPEKVIEKIRELTREKRLVGISDIADLSDRKTGLRLVIDVKNGYKPEAVLSELYRLTPLQVSFGVNAVSLVDGQPRTLGLKAMLEYFVTHRVDVVKRRTEHRKACAQARLHIVDGLLTALASIDEVVAIIRKSKNVDTAREKLAKLLKLDAEQIKHILEMPLRRLTGLEVSKLKDEAKALRATIRDLNKILKSKKELEALVIAELDAAVEEFGSPRKSVIVGAVEDVAAPIVTADGIVTGIEVADEPCTVVLASGGFIGRVPAEPSKTRAKITKADAIISSATTTTRSQVGILDAAGTLHRVNVVDIPDAEGRSKGAPVAEYADVAGTQAVAVVPFTGNEETGIAIGTSDGVVKRILCSEFATRNRAASVISLNDGATVVGAMVAADTDRLVFVTSDAQVLATPADKVRPQGRGASGVAGARISDGAVVVAFAVTTEGDGADVVTVSDSGRVKSTPADDYPSKGRGTGGVRCMKLLSGENAVASAWVGTGSFLLTADSTMEIGNLPTAKRDASGEKGDIAWTGVTAAKPRG